MRKSHRLLFAVGALAGAQMLLARVSVSAETPPLSISLVAPRAAFDTSDLDARDAFNRRIQSTSARRDFEQLWERSLFQMLMAGWTPTRRHVADAMSRAWSWASGVLDRRRADEPDRHAIGLTVRRGVDAVAPVPGPSVAAAAVSRGISAVAPGFRFLLIDLLDSTRLLR